MKWALYAASLAFIVSLSAFGIAPTAHAADCSQLPAGSTEQLQCIADEQNPASAYDANAIQSSNDAAMQAQLAADKAAAAKTVTDPDGISSGFGPIMTWIASLFAWLVGVAALTLDFTVYYTIIRMGDYIHRLTAIGVTWRILRDIGNIALIFGFLAIGISTILNTERLGWGKKLLPSLLLAAVFINFSLFFAEAIIDTGNLFATQFFTEINGNEQVTADFLEKTTIGSEGISNKIMAQVGLQTIYTQGNVNSKVFKAGNTWTIGFMSILLFIVTAFVMFSLAFILIARFVFLVFLIILAPLGFAGLAIPQLAGRAKWWWDSLFDQTITAPILLLLLYIALAVITDASFLTGLCQPAAGSNNTSCQANWLGYVDGNFQGFASMLLTFFIAMGLLLLVTIVAKRLSAFGADNATKFGGKLSFGLTAWGMNRTVGRGAYFASRGLRQNKTFNKVNAATGRIFSGTLDRVANGSMDVRGVTAGGGLKGLGVDAGAPIKGFADARKLNIKAHEEEVKRIEDAHKDAFRETPEEAQKAAEATSKHNEAMRIKTAAETERVEAGRLKKEAAQRLATDTAQAEELAQKLKKDPYLQADASFIQQHDAAQEKAKKSVEDLEAASAKLAKAGDAITAAEDAVKAAEKAKTDAEGAGDKRMKENIKASKLAYAGSIDTRLNPINFVLYGPDSSAAARKIIKDVKAKKSTKDQLAELAKKAMKEEEDEKNGSGEKKEEKKPDDKPADDKH